MGCRVFCPPPPPLPPDHAEGLGWEVGRTRIIYYPHFVDEKTEEQRCD